MKTRTLLFIFLFPVAGAALESQDLVQATNTVFEQVLAAHHDSSGFMRCEAERNGWTPSDCAQILVLAERSLAGSTVAFDVQRREIAIGLMGEFGGEGVWPELSRLVENESESAQYLAAFSLIESTKASPVAMESLTRAMSRPSIQATPFATQIIHLVKDILSDGGPEPSYQGNLLRILLDRVSTETHDCALLDEILCREVPRWRASPQRAENAARMIREHSADSRLVAFFETVRTNALESARAERGASPGASTTRAVPADAESDPWADLLSDLPEKKPWTPPANSEMEP